MTDILTDLVTPGGVTLPQTDSTKVPEEAFREDSDPLLLNQVGTGAGEDPNKNDMIVDLILPGGTVLERTLIPVNFTGLQVLEETLEQLSFPDFIGGQRVHYWLRWVEKNLVIDPNRSLCDFGLRSGASLELVSSRPPDPRIGVTISVLDLNSLSSEMLPYDMQIESLVQCLIKKYRLPERDQLNDPVLYFLRSKRLERLLEPLEILGKAGVSTGDRLFLMRQELAD